jgi:hypothetical protein
MTKVFGREPAYWLALASGLIALVSAAVFPLTVDQQGVLNAVVAALLGITTAWALKGEGLVAALVGFFKAAIAAGLAFGLSLSPDVQSTAMVVVELVLTGVLVRPNVVAPVPASVSVDPWEQAA